MEWARKWWLANAFMVPSVLRVLFGLPAVIVVQQTLTFPGSVSGRISNFATAHPGAFRGLFTMMVLLLSSCVGFGTYWHWSDETSLTNGIIASSDCRSQNCAKSKRAFSMEVIVAFVLPLLVTVNIYLYRWNNRAMIADLNRNFRCIYDSHQHSLHAQRQYCFWDQYGRLVMKQLFEVMALGVLWLNLRPLNHTEEGGNVDNYWIRKLISSMAAMLPAVVCVLVSIEMGIIFSFIARTLTILNWSLDSWVRCSCADNGLKRLRKSTLIQHLQASDEWSPYTMDIRGYLRKCIAKYDELCQFMLEIVQFYSSNLLLIIGMHFILFTMQVCVKYLFLYWARTNRSLDHRSLLTNLLFYFVVFICKKWYILLELYHQTIEDSVEIIRCVSAVAESYERNNLHKNFYDEIHKSVTIFSLIVRNVLDSTNLYGYFDLDRSLVMTIIASTCSYLIVLIQVM
ncbi:AGAP004716-PA [Anopheles gambiae str. PEST]|uniref:Gustatory receptor n=2 Tax=gambiae species complex TaxID=44542 RepID=A7UUW5_ANOGA|nr:AGAP004716-PA [Anopheles gambiae str. PEST]